MEWLSQNWVWVLLIAGFVAMHMFGHGGHGGHGGSSDGGNKDARPASKDVQGTAKKSGHQH